MSNLDTNFQGKSILVAEDDEVLRDTVAAEFEMQGARVFAASDGKAAFQIVSHEKIDGVVSDIRMPGGDGIELLKHIKEVSHTVPVLMFMTGFADLSVSDAYDLGAEDVLRKPFNLNDLVEAAGKMLLPKAIRWRQPLKCSDSPHKIVHQYVSLESAIESKSLQFGRGGVFIRMGEKFPPRGKLAGLRLDFESGPVARIEGCVTTRWIRTASDGDLIPGVGVEFEQLSSESTSQIGELINRLKVKPYIPKI